MFSLLKDFFQFCFSKKNGNNKPQSGIYWIVAGLILLFGFKSFLGLIRFILLKNNLITSTLGPGSPEEWIKHTSFNTFAIQVVLLAPILEEFAFRGVLQKNKTIFNFSFAVFVALAICKIAHFPIFNPSMFTIIVLFSVLLLVVLLRNNLMITLNDFVFENYKVFVFTTSILFALWHYGNFDFHNASIFTILFTFFPYFISGLIFAWISIRKGFKFGLLLHIVSNSFPVILSYFNFK